MSVVITSLALWAIGITIVLGDACLPRDYGNGGTVCVCNADYCDTVTPVQSVAEGSYLIYTSNKAGLRFSIENGAFENEGTNENVITVDQSETYQEIFGWGGAFTDATGININSLSSEAKERLLRSYFSTDGLEYNLCRVPIAATDFSTHAYTYVDEDEVDEDLNTFSLRDEDHQLKIPLILEALNLTDNELRLFASAWIAPKWMKLNGAYSGILGFLKTGMYQAWANYFLKFLEAYDNEGVPFWGITTGNEPSIAYTPVEIPSVAWTPSKVKTWVNNNLGPTLRNSSFSNISIMALDDQRSFLPWYIDAIFESESVKNYFDGIAVHWYLDKYFSASLLTDVHNEYPEKFLLGTEACVGSGLLDDAVSLGSWSRGEEYIFSILEDVNHWMTGWVDWNMVLDSTGGPTYIDNNVDAPIIVNATADEFYKQPTFYAMGHFSKFVPRGSVKIGSSQFDSNVPATAFRRPDGGIVVVVSNQEDDDIPVTIADETRGEININLTAHSFTSILYW